MIISYTWLSSYMTNAETAMPDPKTVADLFTMRAFEIESMEAQGDDTIYDIKLTTDRSPYTRSIRYVALELSLLVPELVFNPKFATFTKTSIDITAVKTEIDTMLVEESTIPLCPMYSLTKIENVHNNTSPDFIIEKLKALGQQSRGTIVDLTNYVMYDTGQPLHAFDADNIDGKIRVAILDADTEVTILGGKKITVKKGMLVIKDGVGILAIAGVKGCVKAEVTNETKNIYLESATFDRVSVRKTSRTLDIINDSSKCFEQGVSSERFLLAVETYINLLTQIIPTVKVESTKVSQDVESAISSLQLPHIQVHIDRSTLLINPTDSSLALKFCTFLEQTLPKTGAYVEKIDDNTYTVLAPLYRSDLQTEADVVDEFMRNVGYGIIPYIPTPIESDIVQEKKYQVLKSVRKVLVEKGFTEVLLHTLVDNKKNPEAVVLENALTSERNSLRALLSPEMENAIIKNFPFLDIVGKTCVKLFEIGYVFEEVNGKIKQKLHIAIGTGMPKQLKKKGDISSHVLLIHELFPNIPFVTTINEETGRYNTEETVYITEADITDHVENSALEEDREKSEYLSQNARIKTFPYKKASIYPSMSRDIAFFVEGDDKEAVHAVVDQIVKTEPLIETVTLFDVFTKEDKTSYGYRFVFQSYEKTLREEEVHAIMDSIRIQVQAKGWVVR